MNPVSEANSSGGVQSPPANFEAQRNGGIGSLLGKALGIEIKKQPTAPANSLPSENSQTTLSQNPIPESSNVSSVPPETIVSTQIPGAPTESIPKQDLQLGSNNQAASESVSATPDTIVPPSTQDIVAEEPKIVPSVDQTAQNIVSPTSEFVATPQPVPEMVVTPTVSEPAIKEEPQIVTTVTPSENDSIPGFAPVVSTAENQGNILSQNESQVKKPINFLEEYLLKHHLKNYVKESGEIDEEALEHDAQNPDKLQEIDPRIANLVKGLTDRGLSMEDPLIAAGVEEVYMEDQKKAA